MTQEAIEHFADAVSPFLSDFRAMDLRIVAAKQSLGYVFEAFRVVLVPSRSRALCVDLPRSKDVSAIHAIWDIKRLPEFLDMLAKGEIILDDTLIHLKRKVSADKWVPLDNLYYKRYDRMSSSVRFGMDTFCVSLEAFDGSHIDPSARVRIDDGLKCEEKPWDGIDDLKRMFANQSRSWGQEMSFLEVIAPIGVRFDKKVVIESNRLCLGANRSAWWDGKELFVACLIKRRRSIQRSNVVIKAKAPYSRRPRILTEIPLPDEYEWVKCILMYRGSEVDRYELYSSSESEPSRKWSVFSELTGGIEQFKDLPSGQPLEASMEVLFHLLGFETAHYGGRSWRTSKPTPDVIAFPKKGDWYIVLECTGRDPDLHNKLGILSTRSRELAKATPKSKVYPVVFTAMPREVVNRTDIERAAKEQISVITADDLPKLVDILQSGKGNDEVLLILQHQIPGLI